MYKILEILEGLWRFISFIPAGIGWVVNTYLHAFLVFVRIKQVFGVITDGSITNAYIPDDMWIMLAPIVSLVLFFGIFTITRRFI